jgi:hypothetical protein
MGNLKILWNVRILRLQSLASMWSCKNFSLTCIITRKSAKTNGIIDEIFSSVIFTDRYNSVSTSVVENTDRIIPSVKFSGKIFFFGALTVCKTVGVWLFFLFPTELATEWKITDDQYSDGQISSVRSSGKILPMNCVPYTNGMNILIKLFNGVVHVI